MSSSERQQLSKSKSSLASLCTTCKERSLSDKERIICQGSTCNKWSHLSCLVETTKYSHTALRALFNDRSRVYLCDICVSRNEIYVLLVKAVEYKKWRDHPKYKKQKDFSYLFLEGGVIDDLNQCLRGLLETISVDNKSNVWVKKTHETVVSAILDRSDPLLDKERDDNDHEWMTDETRQHLDTFSHVYRRYNNIPDQKNKEAVYIARNKYNNAARTVRGVYNHIAFHEKKIRNVMRHCLMSLYEKYSTRTIGDQRNAFEKEFCEFFTNITYRNDMMKVQKYVESEASGASLTEMITLHNLYANEGGQKTHKSSPKNFQKVGGLVKLKKKKKKKKVYESLDSGSEDEGIDTDVKLYPLSHYINDQEEMVAQMFATIRGSKLLAMLPPALKSVPLKELKHLCLHELCGMSKKRILCIINGQEMEGSSEEEEEEDEEENEEKEERSVTKVVENEVMTSGKAANKQDKRKIVANEGQSFLLKKIKVEPGLEDKPEGSQTGKSVMELLELEMRARIIKTMLEKGEDGKKITEDAIAGVMNSATQLSIVADRESLNDKEKVAATSVKGKSGPEGGTLEEGTDDDRESERGSRGSHRKHSKSRRSSRRRRRRRDGNVESDRKRKAKDQGGTEKCTPKKKKITRREFEERMKRAKQNRNYRQHNTEEDEHKERESESQENYQKELDNKEMAGTEQKEDLTEDSRTGNKTGEETGEVSEKEEGEWDSNEEEEEGACTPSDISSKSSCYSSSYSSRSRSRSYSRSPSRIQRKRRRRSYSRSRSRSRRSCTRSKSRSRSVGKRGRNDGKRNLERKNQIPEASSSIKSKGTIVKLPLATQKQASKEEEDNWGQKCDIEFVDSEEDFDDIPPKSSITSKSLRTAKAQGIERASISFSLQKKQGPTITPNVDLDDLPLKSGVVNSTSKKSLPLEVIDVDKVSTVKKSPNVVEIIDVDKPLNEKPEVGEEILISSDSEGQECISSISAKPRVATETSISNTASKSKTEVNINTSTEPKVAGELGISNTLSDSDDKAGQPSHRNEGGKDDIVLYELDKDKMEKKNLDLDYSEESKIGKSEQSLGHKLDNQQRGEEDDDLNMGHKVNENDKNEGEVDNIEAREQACFFTKDLKGPDTLSDTQIIAKTCNVETESDVQLESQKSSVKVVQIDASSSQLADTEELGEKDAENSTFAQNSKKEQEIGDDSQVQEEMADPQTEPVCTDKGITTDNRSKHTNTTKVKDESSIKTRRHGRLDSDKILAARKVTTKRSSVKERISKKKFKTVGTEEQFLDDKEIAANTDTKAVNDTETTKELLDEVGKTEDGGKEVIHKDCDLGSRDKEDGVENTATADEAAQSKKIVLIEEQMENVHENVKISETDSNKESSDAMDVKVCESEDTEKLPEFESENKTLATDNQESEGGRNKCQNELISVSLEEIIRVSLSKGKTGSVRNKNVALEKDQMSSISVKEKLEDTDQSEHQSLTDESLVAEDTTSTHYSEPFRTESGPIRKYVLRPKKVEIKMPLTNVDKEENESKGIVSVESGDSKELKKDGTDLVEFEQVKKSIESTSFDHDSPNPVSLQMKSSHPLEESDSDEHEMKAVDAKMKDQKETDIIGVIEASNASASMCDEDIDLGGSSWSMRWLQSDKVQKVVTSSKMLSRVRKKIQKKGMATKKIASENIEYHHKKATESPVQVIGSIEEYERMFGIKVKAKTKEETESQPQQLVPQDNLAEEPVTASASTTPPVPKKAPAFGSDDEGEDSEEEALWSKILGK